MGEDKPVSEARFASPPTLPKDIRTPTNVERQDAARFQELVHQGALLEKRALNGQVYSISMPDGDFPIAFQTNGGQVVRIGDKVQFERYLGGGEYRQLISEITGIGIDEGRSGEIFLNPGKEGSNLFRPQDITSNVSAIERETELLRSSSSK